MIHTETQYDKIVKKPRHRENLENSKIKVAHAKELL